MSQELTIDHHLLANVEKYATGQTVHALATARTVYRFAPVLHQANGDERYRELFETAERELRAFVAKARQAEAATLNPL